MKTQVTRQVMSNGNWCRPYHDRIVTFAGTVEEAEAAFKLLGYRKLDNGDYFKLLCFNECETIHIIVD